MSAGAPSRDWDADTYDRVSEPQVAWAHALMERLALCGHESVLDAGCGSGRVTKLLVERLPHGRVVAVDASPAMVAHARAALGTTADVRHADLVDLNLGQSVDAVFSNAVFHWIPDHPSLFARLHAALRPAGRLVAQCGGSGNVGRLHAVASAVGAQRPFAPWLGGWKGPWNFATAEGTEAALAGAGFEAVSCWLEPSPVVPPDPERYLATVCLGHHLERLPVELREPYVEAVAARSGEPLELDYVRLNICARRPA